ncbi:hypothetical protein LCGC14_2391240 [marine sediment metagenome]|uniref:Uncharacterized protein n=1 Tax=marine sediment metagenome TaxID=412755 RepID=A0A0F9BY42_9ZZZZ
MKIELCACNGLACCGICREMNYERITRTAGPKCIAAYYPEPKRKKEQKQNRNV